MGPSSPPTPYGTGAASAAPAPATSTPARPGRTPGSSPTARMRDELLAIEQFDSLLEAQVLVADWRSEYNDHRPHSALGVLTRASSLGGGGPTTHNSHSGWTDDWGPARPV